MATVTETAAEGTVTKAVTRAAGRGRIPSRSRDQQPGAGRVLR